MKETYVTPIVTVSFFYKDIVTASSIPETTEGFDKAWLTE